MRHTVRGFASIAAVALVGSTLTGCQLFETGSSQRVLTDTEECLAGQTWHLDLASLSDVIAANLAAESLEGEVVVGGTQTLSWDRDALATLTSDLEVSAVVGDWIVTSTATGTSSGIAYFNANIAVPRNWDESALTITESATGGPEDAEPFTIGRYVFDDTVGLEVECGADTVTISARGTKRVWVYHPADWVAPAPEPEPTPTA